jgi:hypothetical protein
MLSQVALPLFIGAVARFLSEDRMKNNRQSEFVQRRTNAMRFTRTLLVAITLMAALIPGFAGEIAQPTPTPIHLLDLQGLSTDEKVATYALAGLLNRSQPQVFLRGGKEIRKKGSN